MGIQLKKIFFLIINLCMFQMCISNDFQKKKIAVPKQYIQKELEKRFPVEYFITGKNILEGSFYISDPVIDFIDDRVYLQITCLVNIRSVFQYLQKVLKPQPVSVLLSGKVFYKSDTYEIYLKDMLIDKLIDNNGNEVEDGSIIHYVEKFFFPYVLSDPIYTFSNDNSKFMKEKIKNIFIQNGKLYIQL